MAATNESTDKRLFLLDAYALIYRAHFALIRNPLINSKGMNVSAISGFTNTLNDLLRREQPSHLAVVFDLGTTTREEEFSYYKANRQEMPEDIAMSIPIIKEVVRGFNVPVIELEGYEADDLIGTLAKQAEKEGYTTYMVTPDKDFGQLISENIFMYKPAYMGKPIEVIGLPEVLEKWQIERPEQVIDILGLMGDSVDNIPGIPKVGPKTAMKLIGQYGSVEEIIAHGDEIKGKLGENIREFAQQGLDSKLLATIILDAPIEFKEDEFLVEPPDKEKLGPLFAELEFRTIGKRILGDDFNISSGGVRAANRTPKPAAEPAGPSTGQMDLFGGGSGAATAAPAAITAAKAAPQVSTGGADLKSRKHEYQLVESAEGRAELLSKLKGQ
jgi:DNA polymerase-1